MVIGILDNNQGLIENNKKDGNTEQNHKIDALHIQFQGLTSFFKHPLTITGVQISLPCPPYSTLLGLISACAGYILTSNDVRIGYEYSCNSINIELERTDRLVVDDKGRLKKHREGQGILKRYVHYMPILDLYITNISMEDAFKNPVSTPTLGRSQDILWITKVEKVILESRNEGFLGATMLSYSSLDIPSLIIRCPEWFENNKFGITRIAGPISIFQAMSPTSKKKYWVKSNNLYHSSNLDNNKDVIYLHDWTRV